MDAVNTTLLPTAAETANVTYCNFTQFANAYKGYHGYLSMFVCIFGSVTNVFNICVLTTREMRWPTNLILTGLAVTDLLVMLEYIPFVAQFYLAPSAKQMHAHFSYAWAVYTGFHALFTQICHFISCCLTVVLAVWRYIAISQSQNNELRRTVTSIPRTLATILMTYLWCPLICIPFFMAHSIEGKNKTMTSNGKIIANEDMPKESSNASYTAVLYTLQIDDQYKTVSFLLYGLVLKLVPCILLTILSLKIIGVLLETKKRRRLLLVNSGVPLVAVDMDGSYKPASQQQKRNVEKEHQTDRTTRMLLTVLLLFLITEFPQALVALLSVIYGEQFEKQCYHPLGDLMDILALTNSAINFVLYCSMSRQFRMAFREVFKLKVCDPWVPLPLNPPTEFNNGGTTQVTFV